MVTLEGDEAGRQVVQLFDLHACVPACLHASMRTCMHVCGPVRACMQPLRVWKDQRDRDDGPCRNTTARRPARFEAQLYERGLRFLVPNGHATETVIRCSSGQDVKYTISKTQIAEQSRAKQSGDQKTRKPGIAIASQTN
jgi:hypothetical protein